MSSQQTVAEAQHPWVATWGAPRGVEAAPWHPPRTSASPSPPASRALLGTGLLQQEANLASKYLTPSPSSRKAHSSTSPCRPAHGACSPPQYLYVPFLYTFLRVSCPKGRSGRTDIPAPGPEALGQATRTVLGSTRGCRISPQTRGLEPITRSRLSPSPCAMGGHQHLQEPQVWGTGLAEVTKPFGASLASATRFEV